MQIATFRTQDGEFHCALGLTVGIYMHFSEDRANRPLDGFRQEKQKKLGNRVPGATNQIDSVISGNCSPTHPLLNLT